MNAHEPTRNTQPPPEALEAEPRLKTKQIKQTKRSSVGWERTSVGRTCDQLPDLHVRRLPQQAHQSRDPSAVLQGDLVVVVGFAVHQVPEGSAGAAVHVGHPVVQQVHQQLDAALPTDLSAAERSVGEK